MPRSSRHKSSKHSTRDVRDYSDSEKESGVREKKVKEGGHLKESSSSERRKLDSKAVDVSSKELVGLGNAEYTVEFGGMVSSSSSRKRKEKEKEKVDDDRWTGGGDDSNGREMSKSELREKEKEKEREVRGSGDSKRSSRREGKYVSGFDVEEGKRSGGKSESKHHRSERKERGEKERGEKERGSEREKKGSSRSDKGEKLVDIVSVDANMGSEADRKRSGWGEERGGKHNNGGKSDKVNSESLVDIVSVTENIGSEEIRKQSFARNTDSNLQDEHKTPDAKRDTDRKVRRKRDGSGLGDRHHDAVRDSDDRRPSSREEITKSGRYKDDGHKEDRVRDRLQEDIDKEIWRQDEKLKDDLSTRDHTSVKNDDKNIRNGKKELDLPYKKTIPHGGDYDQDVDRDRERGRDQDRDQGRDHDRDRGRLDYDRVRVQDDRDRDQDHRDVDRDRERGRDQDRDQGRDHDRDRGRDQDRDQGRDHDRDRGRDQDRDQGRDHDRDRGRLDYDRVRVHDDRDRDQDRDRERERERVHDHERERDLERIHDREPAHHREHQRDRYRRDLRDRPVARDHERGRDRNFSHDHDSEYGLHADEKNFRYKDERGRHRSPDVYDDSYSDKLRRTKTEGDRERSLSRKPIVDSVTSSTKRKASPSYRAYVASDKYRDGFQDETKHGDSLRDAATPEAVEKASKYQSGEKRARYDDNHAGEISERSPNAKASPADLKERSPSTMSYDRSRFSNRNTRRRSVDADDAERRSSGSNGARDKSMTEDRQGLPSKKFFGDENPPPESPFYPKNKSGQGNTSSHGPSPGPPVFRTRPDSPFVSSFGEDNRGSGNRFRRSVDPNVGRVPGNAWNGALNWPSPHPNGFMPYPPGPPGPHHGGFPPLMSPFSPIFGARPALDMNHPGMPYHMADGDRFPGYVRPMGWPNVMEGPMPPHFHGWDASNSMLRDDSSMYGPGHLAQRRDVNSDMWKQNGAMNMDVVSGSQKDGPTFKATTDEASSKPNVESNCPDDQATSFKKDVSSGQSPVKDSPLTQGKGTSDKTPESSDAGVDDTAQFLRAYLGRLDISVDLVDPELYNQCINRASMRESEYVEDEVELQFMEENAVVKSEITSSAVDMKTVPAAKDSIFQRAMTFYKTEKSERRIHVLDAGKIQITCSSPSHPNVEQISDLETNVDTQSVSCDIMQEDPVTQEGETEKPVPTNIQNPDSSLDVTEETQTPQTPQTPIELVPEGELPNESSDPDPIISKADEEDTLVDDDGKIIASNGSLNVCNDFVKVCEVLIPVPKETESVVLSRIHDAPESTH